MEDLTAELESSGVIVRKHPWVPGSLELKHAGDLTALAPFQNGKFLGPGPCGPTGVPNCRGTARHAGAGRMRRAGAASPSPPDAALDCVACDLHENKLKRIREGAERLGLTCIRTEAADGRVFRPEWEDAFDAVLVDAPCSGLGIIRKKPDVRYKKPDDLFALPVIQRAILDNAARYVKPGGTLVYSTCTILPEENQEVTDGFLAEHPDFVRTPFALPDPVGETEGQVTLWPHRHTHRRLLHLPHGAAAT